MKQRPRIYYSDTQKAMMWDRWEKGDSMHAIARLFDRGHSSIQRILSETGGIRPLPRNRSKLSLTLAEREEISRGLVAGHSLRSIAASLGRAPSTVSREVTRNGGRRRYRANRADQAAWERSHRPKRCKLVENRALAHIVAKKLKGLWSPEQIAGWLKHTYPNDENYQVSHETIYRSLYIQARGAIKRSFFSTLGEHGSCVARVTTRRRLLTTAGLPTPYRSVNGQPRLRTEPYQVTGKATLLSDQKTARSQPW